LINCSCGGLGCKLCLARQTPKYFFPVEPMGAVRTTQKQKFVDKRAIRYHQYKSDIALMAAARKIKPIQAGNPVIIRELVFYMPIPQSWSNKKKQEAIGQPHIKKPDIDNLVKGLFDSLNGIAWADDNQVYEMHNVKKIYGEEPGIEFGIDALEV
jgi:Holliday junction resolvase RusA-like endonuclease